MIVQKKIIPWFLVVIISVCLLPVKVHANEVSNCSELSSAIASAATDGTETEIDICTDIVVTETINIPKGANVKLTGKGGKITTTVGRIFASTDAPASLSFYDLEIYGNKRASDYSSSLGESDIYYAEGSGASLNVYGSTKINTNGYVGAGKVGTNANLNIYGGEVKGQINCVGWDGFGFIYPTANISIEGMNYSAEMYTQNGYSIDNINVNNVNIYNANFEELSSNNALNEEYLIVDCTGQPELVGSIFIVVDGGSGSVSPQYSISPKTDVTDVKIGDTVKVNAVVTADQAETPLAAVDAVLDYDKELMKLVSAEPIGLTSDASTVDLQSGRMVLNGDSVAVGEDGVVVATYTFEALKAGDAKFSIAEGAKVGQSGNPTDLDAVSGDPLTVTITEPSGTVVLVSNADYKGTADGQQMLRYTGKALPKEGNAYYYGETPLQYVGPTEDGQSVFAGFVSSELQSVEASAIEEKAGFYESVAHDGDVNQNDTVNAIDCQIAYDLATGNKTYLEDSSYELLSVLSRLEADVTNNAVVDALDARAIMNKALGKAA